MPRILPLLLTLLLSVPMLMQAQDRSRDMQPRHNSSSYNDSRRSQSTRRSYHHHGDNVYRTINAVNNTIETAETLFILGSIADYRGVRLGVNMASYRLAGDIDHLTTDSKIGMNAGFVLGFQCGKSPVYIEPGLYYSGKGGVIGDYEYSTHAVEIPIVAKYNIRIDDDIYLQPFAGFFLAYGFAGRTEEKPSGETFDTFCDEGFKDFDSGLRAGLGLEIGRFCIEAAYDLGLSCLPNYDYADNGFSGRNSHIRSGCLSLGIGFNF